MLRTVYIRLIASRGPRKADCGLVRVQVVVLVLILATSRAAAVGADVNPTDVLCKCMQNQERTDQLYVEGVTGLTYQGFGINTSTRTDFQFRRNNDLLDIRYKTFLKGSQKATTRRVTYSPSYKLGYSFPDDMVGPNVGVFTSKENFGVQSDGRLCTPLPGRS